MNCKQDDFLVIGPYCWGRSKKLTEALRCAKANRFGDPKDKSKPYFKAWRLSDEVDQVEVLPDGSFTYDAGEVEVIGYFNFNLKPVEK